MAAKAVFGPTDVRGREIRVSTRTGEVRLGVKTVGRPEAGGRDPQKQNVFASLTPEDARELADALIHAADSLVPQTADQAQSASREASAEGIA